jgi:hypothetical protein
VRTSRRPLKRKVRETFIFAQEKKRGHVGSSPGNTTNFVSGCLRERRPISLLREKILFGAWINSEELLVSVEFESFLCKAGTVRNRERRV